jgi:membrane fusion protein (multidrug efflux system)
MNAPAAIQIDTAEAVDIEPAEAAPRRRWRRNPLLAAAVALLIALVGAAWLLSPRTAESTDNAYVRADSSTIAPKVGGLVAEVLVRDNELVHAGQPLVRIDTRDFDARVAAAEADLADAVAGVADARAALDALGADTQLAAAGVRAAQTSIGSADAEYSRASADRARYEALSAQGFATRRDLERIRATAVGAASALDRTRADRDVASRQAGVTLARRPVLEAQLAKAQAAEARARATLDLARQDRGHAVIVAPIDGVVGNRQVQIGDFVQPGTRLLTLVPAHGLYVVANFKETQTRAMMPGQPVTILVDALGGEQLRGHVESLAPASGSDFSLLPFEPGSGNFTKIVQRVGVRIALDPDQPVAARLRSGLSVTATVRLKPV